MKGKCMKKDKENRNRKKKITIYLLISILFLILGVEVYLYFRIKSWEFADIVQKIFGKAVNPYYFSYGILILTFLLGTVYAIIATIKADKKGLAIFIMTLNVICLIVNCGFCGKFIYNDLSDKKSIINESAVQKEEEQSAETEDNENIISDSKNETADRETDMAENESDITEDEADTAENESTDIAENKTEITASNEKEESMEADIADENVDELEVQDTEDEEKKILHAEIIVKDYGSIQVELDGNVAPITVKNFVKLARKGFYDGLTFWRIMDGFMIQGGDPKGDGTGGSKENIKGEFSSNGVENNISHTRGTISMARASDPDSASSQFFIVQSDSIFLDGEYAAFGYVTEGMDVVDKICQDAHPVDGNGTIPEDEQPVIKSIRITD